MAREDAMLLIGIITGLLIGILFSLISLWGLIRLLKEVGIPIPNILYDTTDRKNILYRRLQILQEQQAVFGHLTPPSILIEIEDVEKEIEKLEKYLAMKKEDTMPGVALTLIFLFASITISIGVSVGLPSLWFPISREDVPLLIVGASIGATFGLPIGIMIIRRIEEHPRLK